MTSAAPTKIPLFVAWVIPVISFSLVCWTALRQIPPSESHQVGHANTPANQAVPRTGSGGGWSVANSFFRSATDQALAMNTTDSPVKAEADCSCGWGAMATDFVGRFISHYACNPLPWAFVEKLPMSGQTRHKIQARNGSGQHLVNSSRPESNGKNAGRNAQGARLVNDFRFNDRPGFQAAGHMGISPCDFRF